ncbi:MAG: fused MFS/spermidine synthase [Deltaproteobacteria bacterium]|nr:fused MFS/spermidine synthase [Deltaproteobacteria bacterium]
MATPLAVVLLMSALWPRMNPNYGTTLQGRSFFGVIRVMEFGGEATHQRFLFSGTTLHGVQFLDSRFKNMPTSYYGEATEIGLALSRKDEHPLNVGVTGLGVGTLTAYGHEGDSYRFDEIDPTMVEIARDAGYFSFLTDSSADVEVVLGDARLSIAEEQNRGGSQEYDYLVVDAFSSDAIPVRLLTVEAFRHYAAALLPDGVLAVHVSNRNFNLMSLVTRIDFETELGTVHALTQEAPSHQSKTSHWVLMSQSPGRLRELVKFMSSRISALKLPRNHLRLIQPYEAEVRHVPLWTDDYSDLLGALKWN